MEIKVRRVDKERIFIKDLTLFFGVFLLFTDVFFLIMGILYDMPLMRYVIYFKLVVNTTNLFLILRKHYIVSTVIIYFVILLFMIIGVVCTGLGQGFQMYALGMLACISYNGYLHRRLLKKQIPMFLTIAIHVLTYAGVCVYGECCAPLYQISKSGESILLAFNSIATFGIVILYVCLYYYVVVDSEEQLERMAMIDNLTGLYNRHFLLATLENREKRFMEGSYLAMLDIDNFKKVNDTYGHNCGDHILHEIASMAQEVCKDGIVCRWGGEEFILMTFQPESFEALRQRIADETFRFEERQLHITVTIGVAQYDGSLNNDEWISVADERLYYGKRNGKNQVVMQ